MSICHRIRISLANILRLHKVHSQKNCVRPLLKRTEGEKEVAKLRDSTTLAERWGLKSLQSCLHAEPFKIASSFTDQGINFYIN